MAVGSGGCSTASGQHSGGSRVPAEREPRAGLSAMAGVSSGVMFGGDVPLVAAESKLGRKLAIVRVYDRMGHHSATRRSTG